VAEIIDGRKLARLTIAEAARQSMIHAEVCGRLPKLVVILVGNDPASEVYVRMKTARAGDACIVSELRRLSTGVSQGDLLQLIGDLNRDQHVHGILVQLPLPEHIVTSEVMDAIAPAKDVDGFHPVNVGRLSTGGSGLVPCTPLGCMMLIDSVLPELRGLNAVVIGKSNIVGKPVSLLLLERECTVTVCHIHTQDLPGIAKRADILVVAAGSPRLVRGPWVRPGAVVIDVGITRVANGAGGYSIVGDVVSDEIGHARAITPVPGGVGPMTIACLMANTAKAALATVEHHQQQDCDPAGPLCGSNPASIRDQ
jgi:methylenetetrahydrofolate dehydrogenase (NADP+) / methenyltetrahydrofolate cyclohydrolase